ncbi:heavy-metal-associated domain-containing protein [Cellvibrio japonicus]|uniref:HMA domain-containing protein n=1 Tax=Cellvibrio japonicus (strain Ueda107) TaxID=498211 RepID=B3PHM2_CELJU|nr:heavy-metal-associated domain-containing protein [Cellvibrio japonicus]ACE83807.1 conserved hypothetical protein [Cellvibrio japonicus Ueda107]QEI12494.1 heavy-metal-associated domain-containing protein [Cellvibrio japonicus]QEI16068.1 heavy-metal-associated domain-containing protein [Cellvibrio japonicus]QEI19646.1 heavy-metal-associated domain-containing protein [Cellvibrio japonicus]
MYRFHVPAMTCDGCARAITRAIQRQDPQASISALPSSHRVDIQTGLDKGQLVHILEEAGYGDGLEEIPHG